MSIQIRIKKGVEQGLIDFLKFLLTNEKVSAVFTLRKTPKEGVYDYGLITDSEMLTDAVPLHPLMPVNAGQELSRFTPMKKPVAAVIKPCELRSFIELVKRAQGSMENFLLISYTCAGCFRFDVSLEDQGNKHLSDYWKAVERGENPEGIRETCTVCEYFVPINGDVTVKLIGEKFNDEAVLIFHTKKAEEMAEGFEGERSEVEQFSDKIGSLTEKRRSEKIKLFDRIGKEMKGLGGMIDVFGRCIKCHGCSRVCPICLCILCDFESSLFDYDVSQIEKELLRKGAMRLPTDTILYQIGRMNHMSFSCVGCGMCTEVCPANISVSAIFLRTGEETAKLFDYVPGRDIEEPVPVTVYKEDELSTLGEE